MRKATGRPQYSMRQNLEGYSFIGLFVIGFLAFTVIPIGTSLVLSFTKYDILSPPQFIGLDNFVQMLTGDHQFWVSFGVTLFYVIVSVPLRLAFALAVAMLLQKTTKLTTFYRAAYYLPTITSINRTCTGHVDNFFFYLALGRFYGGVFVHQ